MCLLVFPDKMSFVSSNHSSMRINSDKKNHDVACAYLSKFRVLDRDSRTLTVRTILLMDITKNLDIQYFWLIFHNLFES